MICPKCKSENPEGAMFCSECGVAISVNKLNNSTLLIGYWIIMVIMGFFIGFAKSNLDGTRGKKLLPLGLILLFNILIFMVLGFQRQKKKGNGPITAFLCAFFLWGLAGLLISEFFCVAAVNPIEKLHGLKGGVANAFTMTIAGGLLALIINKLFFKFKVVAPLDKSLEFSIERQNLTQEVFTYQTHFFGTFLLIGLCICIVGLFMIVFTKKRKKIVVDDLGIYIDDEIAIYWDQIESMKKFTQDTELLMWLFIPDIENYYFRFLNPKTNKFEKITIRNFITGHGKKLENWDYFEKLVDKYVKKHNLSVK